MNNQLLEDFVRRYGITRITYDREANYNSKYSYAQSASGQLAYRNGNTETVAIEVPLRALEHLVTMDDKAERAFLKEYEEIRIRRQYTAVETAYSQYKMLLEIYR